MTTIALAGALILIGILIIMLSRRNAIIRDQGKEIDALRRENVRLKREAAARMKPLSDANMAAAYGQTNPRKISDADAREFLRQAREARERRAADDAAKKRRAEEDDRAAAERRQQPHPTSDPVGIPPHIITMMDTPAPRSPPPDEASYGHTNAEPRRVPYNADTSGGPAFDLTGPSPRRVDAPEPAAEKSEEKRSGSFGGDDSFETGGSIRSSGFETGGSSDSSSCSSSSDSSSSSSSD